MEILRFKRLVGALLIILLNLMLGGLLRLPTSLISLMLTVNSSYIIASVAGIVVGFLGNVLVVIVEAATLIIIYFIMLNINLSISLIYVVFPYLLGVIIGSSFLRRLNLTLPKIYAGVGIHSLSNFLMITGASLITMYFISTLPVSSELVLSSKALAGFKYYIMLCGLICNSFVVSVSTQFEQINLKYVPTYILLILTVSLSWISTPSIILTSYEYLRGTESYFILGKIVRKLSGGTPKYVFGGYVKIPINVKDNKHVVIVGMSGSGKSYLAMKIVKQLAGKHPILIIDPHGEYVELVRSLKGRVLTPLGNPVNPLDTLGKPKNVRAEEVSDMIKRVFRLGNLQKYSLYNLILSTYERLGDGVIPTFNDVYSTLIYYLDNASNPSSEVYLSREMLSALIPYLDLLRGPYLTSTALRPEDLVNGLTVIDLSVVESESLIGIYVESLLYLLETYIKTSSSSELLIIVDEAHKFMGGKIAPLLSKLIMEGRKFGLGLIIITQQPLDLEPSIIANSAYIISFAIQEVNNLNYISKVLCGSNIKYEVVRNLVANLKKHEALVRIRDEGGLYLIKA